MGNSREYTTNFIRVHNSLRKTNRINKTKRIFVKILEFPVVAIRTITNWCTYD